jgi:hypothetical protein
MMVPVTHIRGDLWQSWESGAEVFDRRVTYCRLNSLHCILMPRRLLLDADWAINNGNDRVAPAHIPSSSSSPQAIGCGCQRPHSSISIPHSTLHPTTAADDCCVVLLWCLIDVVCCCVVYAAELNRYYRVYSPVSFGKQYVYTRTHAIAL